jgi:uracil phosphoribosyltransferase
VFRSAIAELGRILVYEAADGWLPTLEGEVETPVGVADAVFVDPTQPVIVVPVLRAGLVMLEQVRKERERERERRIEGVFVLYPGSTGTPNHHPLPLSQAATVLPASKTYHVGYVRDEATLVATPYLNKLPATLSPDDRILIADTMLATGGTIVQVVEDVLSRGASDANVRIVAAVVAPPALKALGERFPKLKVYAGMIDAELDERGYIVPGLGDAGDRAFGTL